MKLKVAHRLQWVFFVVVMLLHKSDEDQGTYNCSNYTCRRPDANGSCRKILCMFPGTLTIANVTIIPRLHSCNKKDVDFGYTYVSTKECCSISVTVCYKVKPIVSMIGNTTTTQDIQSNVSVSGSNTSQYRTTTEAANLLSHVTMEGDFNSTEIQEFQEDTGSLENENVSSSGAVNPPTIAAERQTSNVVLKVALPVGAFVLLIILAVICFVFRRKVKGLMGQFRGNCDKRPDHSNPVYGINGPAFANTTSDKFDNLTYAMQTGQEHLEPVNFQTGVYDDPKPVPREKVGEQTNKNPSNTVEVSPSSNYRPGYEEVDVKEPNEPYDTTYQTLCGERYNTSYDHIMGSKASTMTTPQAKLGGTAYDNAAI